MEPQRPLRFSAGQLLSYGSVLLLLTAVFLGTLAGCREDSILRIDRNLAPETIMTGVPGDSTTSFYRIELHWAGFDRDGEVVGYEWAITDSLPGETLTYKYTTKTDSVFIFSVDVSREVLGHRFYVRAVDNEGKRDPVPAWTFFTVRNNCVPTAEFVLAEAFGPAGEIVPLTSTNERIPTDTIPAGWGVRFGWTGYDCDRAVAPDGSVIPVGRVEGYDYKLGPIELNPTVVGKRDTTVTYGPEDLKSEVFKLSVRARDDAGLSGTDPAVRTFVWNRDPVARFCRALIEGHPDSVEVFYQTSNDSGEFSPAVEGDTLNLTQIGVSIWACMRAEDPDPPYTIVQRQVRVVKDVALWDDVDESGIWHSDPLVKMFTGDYKLMTRALDDRGRWDGSPDTIVFHINHRPRFLSTWVSPPTTRTQRPLEGATYNVPVNDTLRIRFGAMDPDFAIGPQAGLQFRYYFESYPVLGGGTGFEGEVGANWVGVESLDPVNPIGAPHEFFAAAKLRDTGDHFISGDYVLHIDVREQMSADDEARYGSRMNSVTVRFRLR